MAGVDAAALVVAGAERVGPMESASMAVMVRGETSPVVIGAGENSGATVASVTRPGERGALARWFAAGRSPTAEPVVEAGDDTVEGAWTEEEDGAVGGVRTADGVDASEGDRRNRTSLVAALKVAPGWEPPGVVEEAEGR